MNILQASVLAFLWCFFGFIAMGILSALWWGDYTFSEWTKSKINMRIFAIIFGPTLFITVVTYMIYIVAVATIIDRVSIWKFPDWIMAGFKEPPSKPKEGTLDSPTVSP